MKTLLLNPPPVHAGRFISREQCGIGFVEERFVPSEMLLAAAFLRAQGHDVEVLEPDLEPVELERFDAVVVWASVLHTYHADLGWLRRAKQAGSRTAVVLNDPCPGFEHETLERHPFIDVAVRLWERELSLDALLSSWAGGGAPQAPGLLVRDGAEVVDTGLAPRRPDLGHLVSCAGLLRRWPVEKYGAVGITPGRGCTAGCGFCLYADSGSRKRGLDDVLSEIEAVAGRTARVYLLDPDFGSTRDWTARLCTELVRMGSPVRWRTDLRPEHAEPELLELLRQAGCDEVLVAVETLDPEIRDRLGVGLTAGELRSALQEIRRAGIRPAVYFMVGLPWDSADSLGRLLDLLREEPIASFFLKQVRPWPGTPVFDAFATHGLIDRELRVDDFVSSGAPICPTLHLSRDQVEEWKHRIGRAAILQPGYVVRFLKERRLRGRHVAQGLSLLLGKNIFKGA